MTYQYASIGGSIVGDGESAIRGNDIPVKIDQPFAAYHSACCSHAVGGVAGGTSEASADVAAVLSPTGVLHDLARKIMALGTHAVGSHCAYVGIGKEIGNQLTGQDGLAELIPALEDVGPFGAVGAVRTGASELAVIVAVVAIGAKYLDPHGATLLDAIQIQHIGQQARLRERAASAVHDGMARSGCDGKLGDQVERVT